jgi:hypothetical protein
VKANEILVDVTVLNGRKTIDPHTLYRFAAHHVTVSLATHSFKDVPMSAVEKSCTTRTLGHCINSTLRLTQNDFMGSYVGATVSTRRTSSKMKWA